MSWFRLTGTVDIFDHLKEMTNVERNGWLHRTFEAIFFATCRLDASIYNCIPDAAFATHQRAWLKED
eukprot:7532913-Prorocentrum_lima.AAC.1